MRDENVPSFERKEDALKEIFDIHDSEMSRDMDGTRRNEKELMYIHCSEPIETISPRRIRVIESGVHTEN